MSTALWDDPGIQQVTPGEVECCARCIYLASTHPDTFGGFTQLRYVHWVWRDYHRTWQAGDP